MKVVIDTNVLLVANGKHQDVSPECQTECIKWLNKIQSHGVVVIDDGFRILGEYMHKTKPNQPKGVGDTFLKVLLQRQANNKHVEVVKINENSTDKFEEFPDSVLQDAFDPPDRKFVAVANAHAEKPPILQAADCKWLDWWKTLDQHGIKVEFICKKDVCKFYKTKFPHKPDPQLPTK